MDHNKIVYYLLGKDFKIPKHSILKNLDTSIHDDKEPDSQAKAIAWVCTKK